MEDHGFTVHDLWNDQWNDFYFCEGCGLRRPGVQGINIRIDCDRIPREKVLGALGQWNIGFADVGLLRALGVELKDRFYLGVVRGGSGRIISRMRTFCSRNKRVPIRGHEPLTDVVCAVCSRINFVTMGFKRRYVVARVPLTLPVYESNEAQLVVREDVLMRVRKLLPRNVIVEKLSFEAQGHDGRSEPELEWWGD